MPKSTGPLADQLGLSAGPTSAAGGAGGAANQPHNPSIISSEGAIGKQFNPDGAIGQLGQAVGGPFDKEGAIGRQFDASKNGIAGHVERAVDGPRNPTGPGAK